MPAGSGPKESCQHDPLVSILVLLDDACRQDDLCTLHGRPFGVSILVLLDDACRRRFESRQAHQMKVSILVLLDDACRHLDRHQQD